jgi:hypothetical protein
MRLAACFIPMLLVGCGQSYCEASSDLAERCSGNYVAVPVDTCEAATEGCSPEDEAALLDYVDCIDESGICEAAQSDVASFEAAFACLGAVTNLSDSCAATL